MKHKQKENATLSSRLSVLNGIGAIILTLVVIQLWLLMATMNAFLGNDLSIVWPAFYSSLACFLLGLGLLRYIK